MLCKICYFYMRVAQKDIEGNEIKTYESVTHASKILGFKRDLILKCCKGKQKTLKGFIFEYK